MIIAWVLYRTSLNALEFRELAGTDYSHTDPTEWGLPTDCEILLVLQHGSFLTAWIEGKAKDSRQ